jgi:imidazolonepropionase
MGKEGEIGSLEPGKKADLILLDIPNYRYLPYHFGVDHVEIVIKEGRIVYKRPFLYTD